MELKGKSATVTITGEIPSEYYEEAKKYLDWSLGSEPIEITLVDLIESFVTGLRLEVKEFQPTPHLWSDLSLEVQEKEETLGSPDSTGPVVG